MADRYQPMPTLPPLKPKAEARNYRRPGPVTEEVEKTLARTALTPMVIGQDVGGVAAPLAHRRYSEGAMRAIEFAAMMAIPAPGRAAARVAKPAVGKMVPPPQGRFFDLSKLDRVPDVPQAPIVRYAPPRGVPERTTDMVSSRAVQRKLGEFMDEGALMGGARWYNTEPVRKAFVDTLGEVHGTAAYQQFLSFVAATSPRSKVPENIRNASYYYTLAREGKPMPQVGDRNPQPYGHMAQRLHQANAQTVAGEGWDVLKNPKPVSFQANLAGNQLPGTIDAHATNLPAMLAKDPRWLATSVRVPDGKGGFANLAPQKMFASGELTMKEALSRSPLWAGIPNSTEYGAIEGMYAQMASKRGLTTAGGQASTWIAGGGVTGLGSEATPWMKTFEDVLLRTAERNGEKPSVTLERFITGKGALFSLPIATGVAGTVLDAARESGIPGTVPSTTPSPAPGRGASLGNTPKTSPEFTVADTAFKAMRQASLGSWTGDGEVSTHQRTYARGRKAGVTETVKAYRRASHPVA